MNNNDGIVAGCILSLVMMMEMGADCRCSRLPWTAAAALVRAATAAVARSLLKCMLTSRSEACGV